MTIAQCLSIERLKFVGLLRLGSTPRGLCNTGRQRRELLLIRLSFSTGTGITLAPTYLFIYYLFRLFIDSTLRLPLLKRQEKLYGPVSVKRTRPKLGSTTFIAIHLPELGGPVKQNV